MLDRLINILTYDPKNPLIFSSGLFLFLFLGFSFIYMLLQHRSNLRILFVTLFSYYFYYKSSGFYFFLLAVITTSDYFIAEAIGRIKGDTDIKTRKMKLLLLLSLCIDLGFLGYFKYTNFFAGLIADLIGKNFQPWDIFLPVGISFFTFQSMSYVIDVYRGKIKPLGSLMDYAFYVSFFPQLVAGPIVRATDFAPQIRKPVVITREMFARGVYFIMIGLFKKAVISDYISLNFVDRIFDNPTLYSGFENLLGVYGYAMQIYCDFSGYSDMAIGIALLLGFHFPITSTHLTRATASPTSGGGGTSRSPHGYATTSTSRSAETERASGGNTSTSSSPCSSADCGMAPASTSWRGAASTASDSSAINTSRRRCSTTTATTIPTAGDAWQPSS